MRVLHLHAHVFIDPRLAISVMRFEEPGSSAAEEYIGLAEGRLIKVEQEVTTIHQLGTEGIVIAAFATLQ
jgi:hypothetical protein